MENKEQKDAQEMLEKYDRESQFRVKIGRWAWVVTLLGVSLTLFQLYVGLFGTIQSQKQGAIHLGTALGIIFLLFPIKSGDRKSTRLNSSHVSISYAVFCLKKKKKSDYSYL